ncbi:glucosaminidase domain-containing protein [Paenibacillus beijingensis]|uniref:glucosaminidase domain-containing protein n=1 Tax=Paenibacillus beijingensis TaxID=1126833 RepID=UPI000696E8D8|nr:glucosaminidase domain-containing protein [Paenibacillus beijingensis]
MRYTEGAAILTPEDIRNIRSYVHTKHNDMPIERRAQMIADAAGRIIHRQLPDFKEAVKHEITRRLIRTTMNKKSKTVLASDILSVCLELNLREDDMKHPLRKWIGQKLDLSLEVSEFQEAITKVRSMKQQSGDAGAHQLWQTLKNQLLRERQYAAGFKSVSRLAAAGTVEVPVEAPGVQRSRVMGYALLFMLFAFSIIIYGLKLFSAPADDPSKLAGNETGTIMETNQTRTAEAGQKAEKVISSPPPAQKTVKKAVPGNELPPYLRYQTIDADKLKAFLRSRNSLLAANDAMHAIISAAKRYDINPLLMYAITGQEQSFVPATGEVAKKIANNPFNVYHSWQEFNSNIQESASIAAKTIVTLSARRPGEVDPITWINRKYAEDPNWANGVRSILKMLEEIAGTPGGP